MLIITLGWTPEDPSSDAFRLSAVMDFDATADPEHGIPLLFGALPFAAVASALAPLAA